MKHALDRYFEETGDNASQLAERIGRSASSLTRPLRGERNASMDIARDVERGTGGKIKASDFIAICLDAQKAKAEASTASVEPSSDTPPPLSLREASIKASADPANTSGAA